MADVSNNLDPQPLSPAGPTEEKFLATTGGKLVIGGVALLVVLVGLGVIAWVFIFNSGSGSQGGGIVIPQVVQPSSATSSGAAGAIDEPIVDPPQKPLESTFTFRNVFAPTMKQPSISPTVTVTSTSSGSVSPSSVAADTLYLVNIQTVNGKRVGNFIWNGTTYALSEGGTITDTPWKVVEIDESSVVMLYGDTEVTLTVGQGLTK